MIEVILFLPFLIIAIMILLSDLRNNHKERIARKGQNHMGNQIYKEISKFAEMQRDEIKREKAKKKRKSVCIDPDSVIGKEIMYQTALLHEILDEIRGGKTSP